MALPGCRTPNRRVSNAHSATIQNMTPSRVGRPHGATKNAKG